MKIAALAFAAALGTAGLALAPAPASAQSVSFSFGVSQGFGGGWGGHPGYYHRPRPVFIQPGFGHGYGYGRPVYHVPRRNMYYGSGWGPSAHFGPVCRTVIVERWSNRWGGFVRRPVRVCQ